VFVDGGEGKRRRGRGRCEPVEAVLEDRVDVAIGAGLDGAGPGARRFEPLPADGVLPEGFFSTSNLPTYIRVDGRWLIAAIEDNGRTDCGAH